MKARLLDSKFWMVPACYFLWLACTYFWDTSGGFAMKDIERYAIFLFIAPVLAAVPRILKEDIRRVCVAFIVVTTVLAVISLLKSLFEYQVSHDYRVFYYHYLSQQVGLNAIFLSNYCLASITWLFYYFFIQNSKISLLHKLLICILTCFHIFIIFLLSSKMSVFLLVLLVPMLILYIGYLKDHLFRSFAMIVIIGIASFFVVRKLSYLQWRFNVTELKKYEGKVDNNNGLAIRLVMWRSAIELIKERPLIGYGIKGAGHELLKKYRKKNFQLGIAQRYNSHNQFIETTLMSGFAGLFLIMLMIIMAIIEGLRKKNILLLLMLLLFIIKSMVEATLEVQQELIFFLFFIFLFFYHPPNGETEY